MDGDVDDYSDEGELEVNGDKNAEKGSQADLAATQTQRKKKKGKKQQSSISTK